MKVNLIIPKRNRHKQLPVCLHYLNQANATRRYDVAVYIVDDADHAPDFGPYTQLTINYRVKPYPQAEGFRKGALFNEGMRVARRDFEWCSIIDLDMVYPPNFFDLIAQQLDGVSYALCRGSGLDEAASQYVFDNLPAFDELERFEKQPFTSDSQFSFNRAWYERYQDIFQTADLFDEAFVGWGYEDLTVDFVASHMYLKGLAAKPILKGVWRHLYHPRASERQQERRNMALLYRVNRQNEAKLRAYLQRHEDADIRAWLSGAMQAHQQGQFQQADHLYRQILVKNPRHAETLHLLGLLAGQRGQPGQAVNLIRQAIDLEPHNCIFYNNLGEVWRGQNRLDEAIQCFDKAIYIYPYFPEAHYNMANALKQQQRLSEAIEHYQWAVDLKPDYANAHYNLGNTYLAVDQPEAAARAYRQALAANPNFAQAHHNLGTALERLNRPAEAARSYQQAVTLAPDFAEAHLNLAALLHQLGQLAPAGEHYRRATQLDPNHDEAFFQWGNLLQDAGRLAESTAAYQRAIQLNPNSAGAHQNLAAALMEQGQYEQAIAHYRRVIALDPNFSGVHYNLGLAFEMEGKVSQARQAYEQAQRLKPADRLFAFHLKTLCPLIPMSNAEIDHYRAEVAGVLAEYLANPPALDLPQLHLAQVMPPYVLSYQGRDDRPLKVKWAEVFKAQLPAVERQTARRHTKPHIGFVVTKAHETIFTRSMQGILNHLSGQQFQLTIVCDVSGRSKIEPAITNPAAQWLTFQPRFDHALETLRQAAFDLIYYWEIGSDTINYFLPFCRPAPVQCLSWGTAVTSGIPQVDYYLSTELLETDGSEDHYSEQLVRFQSLPTYCYRPTIPPTLPSRSHFGLSDEQHVYFCAQNLLKVHPDFDALAAEILRRDPKGILLFLSNRGGHLAELLKKRFGRTMPDLLARIKFLPRLQEDEYLALMALADVSLDTPHYCGANTSYDAFAAGTPVVTLPGRFQRGRYTYAAYHKMGVLDGIVDSPEAYIDLAVALGSDPAYRTELSAKISQACPVLFEDISIVEELAGFFEMALAKARSNR